MFSKVEIYLPYVQKIIDQTRTKKKTITYFEIMSQISGLDRLTLARILGVFLEEDKKNKAPWRSSIVVNKETGIPGNGYFMAADECGKMKGLGMKEFWNKEIQELFK